LKVTENANRPVLRIYIGKHCWSCEEAIRLAAEVGSSFTKLVVEVIDLEAEGGINHDDVFSTPTYVFNGRTIFLGNPSSEELFARLSALLKVIVADAA
jgi:thioredoxin family protein